MSRASFGYVVRPSMYIKHLYFSSIFSLGGNIMPGYYKDDEATKATITKDGWLRTGDVLRIDEDGVFLYVFVLFI